MRDATQEELASVNNYIKSISKPTGLNFYDAEPCEDAISRKALLKMQYRIDDSATLSTRDVVNVEDIEDAPSVTPKEKVGHWEDSSNGWMCSICDREYSYDTNYCPNCGARMESEE